MKIEYLHCIDGLRDEIMEQYSKDGRCDWNKVINIADGIIEYANAIKEDAVINRETKTLRIVR